MNARASPKNLAVFAPVTGTDYEKVRIGSEYDDGITQRYPTPRGLRNNFLRL
jgi:hypothetical protein